MTTGSFFSSKGLTLLAFTSLASGKLPAGEFQDQITDWGHNLAADGGYLSANFSLVGDQFFIEGWIDQGLGRHIECYNIAGEMIGEYFVNALNASIGSKNIRRGPILSAPNRIALIYAPILDNAVSPLILGNRTVSAVYNNTIRQAQYGIIQRMLSGGAIAGTDIAQILQTFLDEYSEPTSSEMLNVGAPVAPSISLECLGYINFAGAYIYNNAGTGTVAISTRIQNLLAANPNSGMYSTDYSKIAANASTVEVYTNSDKSAYTQIKELVARGDGSYNRYTLGMYANRVVTYTPLPTAIEYIHEITDDLSVIKTFTGGAKIEPWNVKPARWVFDPDFLIGRVAETTALRSDPRNVFIESVNFRAPYQLTINGSRLATMRADAMMKAFGINLVGG